MTMNDIKKSWKYQAELRKVELTTLINKLIKK